MKKVVCPICYGQGGGISIKCRDCNGTGYDSGEDHPAQCHSCYGEGYGEIDVCSRCGGNGFIYIDKNSSDKDSSDKDYFDEEEYF